MPKKERPNPRQIRKMFTVEINIRIWKLKIAKITLTIF